MRRTNVFGKKTSRFKAIYVIIVIFVIAVSSYLVIQQLHLKRLNDLEIRKVEIQSMIDEIRAKDNDITYYEISEIIKFLPTSSQRLTIQNEIFSIRNITSFGNDGNFSLIFDENATSPFTQALPESVKFISISLTTLIEDPVTVTEFMTQLIALDRLYYIKSVTVSYTDEVMTNVSMEIYTFYKDVDVS